MRSDWSRARLEQIADVTMGRQLSPAKRQGVRPRRYLRAANVTVAGIGLADVLEMDFTASEEAAFALRPGDVIVVEGGNGKSVGCPALVSTSEAGLCFQNTLVRLRLRPGAPCTPEYLWLAWRSIFECRGFASLATGTTILHLGARRAARVEIDLPPLAEQRRIVDLIAALDDTVSAYGRVGSASARARNAVMADFFASNAGPTRRLGDVAKVAQGSSLPVALQGSQTGSVPWYKVKDMASLGNDWGYRRAETMIDASTIERHGGRIWPVGAVVFPRVGAAVATEKKRRIELAGACDENHLVVVPGPDLDSGYLLAALENLRLASLVRSDGYPSLNQRIVGDIPLVIPDLNTQCALAQTLEALRSVEEASAAAVAMATAAGRALLDALMSGTSTLPASFDRFLDGAA